MTYSGTTATLNPTVKSMVSGNSRFIIVVIPANYFRADKGDGTYATFPAAETKYVYREKATTFTPVQVTLPTAADKRLRYKMSNYTDPKGVDYVVVITNKANNEQIRYKTPVFEGNEVIVDMSGLKSGNYTYRISEGSVQWSNTSGGIYINEETTGSINNFEGASYFETFTVEMTNRKVDQYGMFTNIPVGQVYDVANKRPINMGQYTLVAPAGTSLTMGAGDAELLYFDNASNSYKSFDEPIIWNASSLTVDTDSEGNPINTVRLKGADVEKVYKYDSFKLVIPAGFVVSGNFSNEPLEVPIYTPGTLSPAADIITVTEEETEEGKYAIFNIANAYVGQRLVTLDKFNIGVDYVENYGKNSPNVIIDNNSIKLDRVINDGSHFVYMPESSVAAVDAYGNWTFNKYASRTINFIVLTYNGFIYETEYNESTYDSDAYITGVVKNYFNDIITLPESIEGPMTSYGPLIYKVIGIRANAFKNAGNATTVVLDNNLETIEAGAFTGAANIDKIITGKVLNLSANAFKGVAANCKVYVPKSVNATVMGGLPVVKANMAFADTDNFELHDGLAYIGFAEKEMALTYNRAFNSTRWEPLFLPFDAPAADFLAHGKVARLEKAETDRYNQNIVWKTMEAGETLTAHTPYLFRANETSTEAAPHAISVANAAVKTHVVESDDATVASDKFTFTLHGVYVPVSGLNGYDNYTRKFYLEDGAYTFTDDAAKELTPMRFYVTVKKNNAADSDNMVLRNVILGDDDNPTLVEGLEAEESADVYYDLSGRRVQNPVKGLYIRNGRKVIVK